MIVGIALNHIAELVSEALSKDFKMNLKLWKSVGRALKNHDLKLLKSGSKWASLV